MPWIDARDELSPAPSRVLVAGTAGSGKTTLARGIARMLAIEAFEIDALYHGADWVPRPAFAGDVEARIAADAWVTEWQYSAVRERLAARAQLLVWLDLPRAVVMRSVVRRTVRRSLGGVELWNGNREPPLRTILSDPDHIVRWAWRTHPRGHESVRACVARHPELLAVRLGSRREAGAWLAGPLARAGEGR